MRVFFSLDIKMISRIVPSSHIHLLKQFASTSREHLKESGIRGIGGIVRDITVFAKNEYTFHRRHKHHAVNVFEKDWELLILLDCATPEMMLEVADEYPFLNDIGTIISIGSCSSEWMRRTFTDNHQEIMSDSMYITGNGYSERHLKDSQFLHLDEVWRDGWSKDLHTVPAPTVTDRAIAAGRKYSPRRTIVHYMQPHLPFVSHDLDINSGTHRGAQDDSVGLQELHYKAGYSREELWDASVDNLRYVLDSVETLLSNFQAERVVISSDHGQAFGEDGIWSHPCHTYINQLTRVPWCVTSATDTHSYRPEAVYDTNGEDDIKLDEKLSALGYK